MRKILSLFVVLMAMMALLTVMAAPAGATVHPISSGDCGGDGNPTSPQGGDPPGITDGSDENADNFAAPILNNPAVDFIVPGDPEGGFEGPATNGDNGNCPNGAPW